MLGKTKKTPEPSCPDKGGRGCSAVGHMTGFQVDAGGSQDVFEAPKAGKLVAWSIALSNPSGDEQKIFEKLLGDNDTKKPTARIAVLRHTKGSKYKLQGEGPLVELREYLGST